MDPAKVTEAENQVCVVASCTMTGDSTTLFSFPDDPALKLKWVTALKKDSSSMKSSDPSSKGKVCEKHFSEDAFEASNKHSLKPQAVPSLNLDRPEPPAKRFGFSLVGRRMMMKLFVDITCSVFESIGFGSLWDQLGKHGGKQRRRAVLTKTGITALMRVNDGPPHIYIPYNQM